jgi:hypothetical protein
MLLINLISILLLVVVSAICKAVADKLAHHFNISIFSTFKNQQFWNPKISWLNKYVNNDVKQGFKKIKVLGFSFTKPIVFSDAWHLFNSSSMFSLLLLVFFTAIKYKLIVFIVAGIFHVQVFNLFYNKILNINNDKN